MHFGLSNEDESKFVDVTVGFEFAEMVKKKLVFHVKNNGSVSAINNMDIIKRFFEELGLEVDFINPSNLVNIKEIDKIVISPFGNEAIMKSGVKLSISRAMTEKYRYLTERADPG
ncbi:hypothetical protein [Paenibacillus mesotrionivorans]|uniref:Uncharacterized protein n=1 Tax=Paenibacillus mesotrionivorans TaxID=3160968 RepID=A0ACC7NY76_9BACL